MASIEANPSALKKQVLCAHCDLPVPRSLIDPAAEHQFCCNGCAAVYEAIHACGLDRYYGLRARLDAEPEPARPTIREKQVYHMLPWAGFGVRVNDYRLLQRGDFVQFWRPKGSGHSVIFWMRDRDDDGRERFWYWSSQRKPRYAYPMSPGGAALKTPGYGVNWEVIGADIDPTRIYGVRLMDKE